MSTKPNTPPPAPSVPVQQGRAPAGMIPAEAALLTAWITKHWSQFDRVEYNVRVGHGIIQDTTSPDFAQQAALANSQRRIDAMVWRGKDPTIVEVKVRGSLWALGQLLGYRQLWLRDNPNVYPGIIMLCGSIDPDTQYVFDTLGVRVEVVTL